ncbi:MAG TPA: hypothetical protein VN176_00520 [Verrucomicrobiae bacterium]|jgi:hypothetical protein|nr:hypothetical protein [Verrucomicrobiae bacterium]
MRHVRHICLLAIALLGLSAWTQQNPQRLVLKDGTYQTVIKWEVKGDRVRYYSADRFMWEELPKDLVDWPATGKYNQERGARRAEAAGQLVTLENADRDAENMRSPAVAPGLRLPDDGGVFLLDDFHTEAQLVELAQTGGEVNHQAGKNILRAAINPLALSSKQTIELKGPRAPVQSHVPQPDIYVNVAPTDDVAAQVVNDNKDKEAAPPAERYRIVHLQKKKDSRVVGNLNIGLTGHVSEKESWIATTTTRVGDWVKVSPAQPLDPGEYAVVEMLDRKQVNTYVWDFGFDPDAAPNPSAWTARKPAQPQNSGPPTLKKPPQKSSTPDQNL